MGIGRREFLQLFGASIASLTSYPNQVAALFGDHYVNRKLGIAFRKPSNWSFADVRDMGEIKSGQILDLDADAAQLVRDATDLPIVLISKEPVSAQSTSFTPGVAVYVEVRDPADQLADDVHSMVADAVEDVVCCNSMLKDFRLHSAPDGTFVSGCEATIYVAEFTFEHVNLQPTPVRMQTLAIRQGCLTYTIRMYDSSVPGSDLSFDYAEFIESVKIA